MTEPEFSKRNWSIMSSRRKGRGWLDQCHGQQSTAKQQRTKRGVSETEGKRGKPNEWKRSISEREGVRKTQPMRDDMELLESERRILSPGCCTGEREREIGDGAEKEGGRDLRNMHHALQLHKIKKRRMTERKRERAKCVGHAYKNNHRGKEVRR